MPLIGQLQAPSTRGCSVGGRNWSGRDPARTSPSKSVGASAAGSSNATPAGRSGSRTSRSTGSTNKPSGPGSSGRGCFTASRLARTLALRRAKLASLLAVQDRDQHLPTRDRAAAQAGAPDRLRLRSRPARRPRRPGERSRLARALPGHGPRARGPGRPRRPLRVARSSRARLHRGTSTPARTPAGRAHPPRRPRLLSPRDRRILGATPVSVDSALTLRDDQIEEITAFVTPETFRRFGLPESVAGS
jgi:hypothetical protein